MSEPKRCGEATVEKMVGQNGRVFVSGAPPKSGKTRGLVEVAKLALDAGRTVTHVSADMSTRAVAERYGDLPDGLYIVTVLPRSTLAHIRERVPGETAVLILDYFDLVGVADLAAQRAALDELATWAKEADMLIFTSTQTRREN